VDFLSKGHCNLIWSFNHTRPRCWSLCSFRDGHRILGTWRGWLTGNILQRGPMSPTT
jgi:hypothetical protein